MFLVVSTFLSPVSVSFITFLQLLPHLILLFVFSACGSVRGSANNFPNIRSCTSSCVKREPHVSTKKSTHEMPSSSSSPSATSSFVETLLAILLVLLIISSLFLGYKHYQAKEAAERYKLFGWSRSSSLVSGTQSVQGWDWDKPNRLR